MIVRRTLLASFLSVGIVGTVSAQTPLQVQQSFKNNFNVILSNFSQFSHPVQSYNGGYRWYLTDNTQSFFSPYGQVNYVYSNKLSLTHSSDIGGGGHGQCVTFVKAVSTPSLGSGSWKAGNYILYNLPQPYTPIAFFSHPNDSNKYDSWGGTGHAALYLGTTNEGIMVLDQNHDYGKTLTVRTIPWYSSSTDPRMSAANYRVIGY